MFGLGKTSSSSSSKPTYFDIRLKTTYKNLLVVRGSHYESPSVVLSGDLVFSVPEMLTVKRISLKLIGRYKLDFLEVLEQSNNTVANPVKEEKTVFQCSWDNLLTSSDGTITIGTNELQSNPSQRFEGILASQNGSSSNGISTRKKLIRTQSNNLHLMLPDQGFSGTPFEDLLTPNGTLFQLPQGNYELPFECILPGDIPETVEGLLAGSLLYKFEANIERSGFNKSAITKHQYFRIFRTLSSDNMSLNETISIGNSWPDKIQYEVSIPSRAIPIGGNSPINILLIPLMKGMKIGMIKAQIVQYYVFKGQNGEIYNDESTSFDSAISEMEGHELSDKISIDSVIKIPSNLKKITQDCDFKQDLIKVRHKLKLQINLIMPNGNVSELRTNLPIILYVSPNVEMSGRTILLDKNGKIHFRKEEYKLFERNNLFNGGTGNNNDDESNLINSEENNNNGFIVSDGSVKAPPNYHDHIHDRIIFTESNNNNNTNTIAQQNPDITAINVSAFQPNDNNLNTTTANSSTSEHNTASLPITPQFEDDLRDGYFGIESDLLKQRLDKLSYEKLSEIPSYVDSLDNHLNTSGEFAPEYKKIMRRMTNASTDTEYSTQELRENVIQTTSNNNIINTENRNPNSLNQSGISFRKFNKKLGKLII